MSRAREEQPAADRDEEHARRARDGEARAAAGAALDGEGAAVRGHDRARDGEAETDATDVAGAGVVEADEGLEDPLGVSGRDARARVLDHEERGLAVARDRDR